MRKLSRKGRHGFAVDAMERTEAVAGQVTDETSHPSSGTRITGRLRAAPAGVFVVAVLQAPHGIIATIHRKVWYRLCSTRFYRRRQMQQPTPRGLRYAPGSFSPLLIGAGGCSAHLLPYYHKVSGFKQDKKFADRFIAEKGRQSANFFSPTVSAEIPVGAVCTLSGIGTRSGINLTVNTGTDPGQHLPDSRAPDTGVRFPADVFYG